MRARVNDRGVTGARRRSQTRRHDDIAWVVLLAWGAGCEVMGEIGAAAGEASTGHGTVHAAEPFDNSGATTSSTRDATSSDDGTTSSSGGAGSYSSGTASSSGDTGTSIGETTVLIDDLGSGRETDDDPSGSETFVDLAAGCCEPVDEPGCSDPAIEPCVCGIDDYCCTTAWDASCVAIASYGDCAGGCIVDEPPPPGDCCAVEGGGGCVEPDVQDCVCAHDPYCCLYIWDDICVEYVDQYECGTCG